MIDDRRKTRSALVIAGGDGPRTNELPTMLDDDTTVIAIDSGLDTAAALGIAVDVAVGDFDSTSLAALEAARSSGVEIFAHPADKDATDLELGLELCLARAFEDIVIIGAGGGRLDHELANILLCASPRWAECRLMLVDDRARTLVLHSHTTLPVGPGALVTLLAVGGPATGVTTTGLRWELENATLAAGSSLGVSNVAVQPEPTVTLESGTLLAVAPWLP